MKKKILWQCFGVAISIAAFLFVAGEVEAASTTIDCSSGDISIAQGTDYSSGDDLTLGGSGTCTLTMTNAATLTSLTILANATVSHAAEASAGVDITTTGDLTINADASINTNGLGCAAARGPDADNVCSDAGTGSSGGAGYNASGGAGHGGAGGAGTGSAGGAAYDSATNPVRFGAGSGGTAWGAGEPGGGLIKLAVSGNMSHSGTITADGDDGANRGNPPGGGAGGSINVAVTGTMAGSGTYSAKGGDGDADGGKESGGGGGGIIVISHAGGTVSYSSSDFDVTGGTRPNDTVHGTSGSVYVKDTSASAVSIFGGFTYDGSDFDTGLTSWIMDSGATAQTCSSGTSPVFDDVTNLTIGGTLDCSGADAFTFGATNVTFLDNASVSVGGNTTVTASTDLTMGTGVSITISGVGSDLDFTIADSDDQVWTDMTVTGPAEGIFTMDDEIDLELAGTTALDTSVQFTALTGFTIGASASINADEKGCRAPAAGAHGWGPNGSNVCSESGSGHSDGGGYVGTGGGGHGGNGGDGWGGGMTGGTGGYDTTAAPVLFGASAGGSISYAGQSGGGVVHLDVTGNMTWNGAISAEGDDAQARNSNRAPGGGAGGSVYITVNGTVSGTTGSLSVAGGDGEDGNGSIEGGGGGGGLTAVEYEIDSTSFLSGLTSAGVAPGGDGGPNGETDTADDGVNGTLTLTALLAFSSAQYLDTNSDGQVDRVDVTFTKNITLDECDVADYTFGGADAGTIAVASCATSGADLQLTISNAPASDTNLTLTWAYTAANGTANSIHDGAGTNLGDVSAQTLDDAAAPVSTAYAYKDTGGDGQVDRFDVTFTENIAQDECEAGDFTIGGADAGTIAVASCATSTTDLQLTVSNAPAGDTNLTLTLAYTAANGTADSLDDADGNAVGNITAQSLTDAAAPVSTAYAYKDTDADGQVDRFDITFSEDIAYDECDAADYTVGGADAGTIAVASCGNSGADLQLTVSNAPAGDTNLTLTLAYTAANGTADSLDDTAGNAVSDISAQSLTDAAAPVITTFTYQDNDGDGKVDAVTAGFSETVTAASVLRAADLTLTNVGDFTSAAYGSATDDLITGSVSSVKVNLGTEASVVDTFEDSGNIAISSQNNFSLTDGTTTNNTLGAQTQASFADGVAPVSTAYSYKDVNGDGQVDRFDITFSENIAQDECEAGDYTVGGADAGTIAVASCATSTTDLRLTVSNAPASDTNLTLTWAYTADNGTADSLDDAAGNGVTDITAQSLTDAAAPVSTAYSYLDTDADGQVDRFDVTFTENIAYDECDSADYTVGGADAGSIAVASCAASTTDLRLTVSNAPAGDTNLTLTLAYTAANGTADSVDDAAGNAVSDISAQSLTDAAAPVITTFTYQDADADGKVDQIQATFSETVTAASVLRPNDLNLTDVGDFTSAAFGSDTTDAISGSVTTATLTLGTEASVIDTVDGSGTLAISTQNGFSLTDGTTTNTTLGAQTQVSFADGAAPIITDFTYQDNDSDGKIDRVVATFSETVTAASVLRPNDLNLTNVGDFTSAAFGADTTDAISGSVSSATITLGTEASVVDTNEGSSNIAISTQNGFSLTDGTNTNTTLGAQSGATFTDGASPVSTAYSYLDTGGDGQIDRFDLTFSENIAYDECDAADYTVGGADAGSIAVASCATSTTDLQLTVSNAPASDTNLTLTLAYTAANGTADSLDDAAGNAVANISAQSLTDAAAPVLSAQTYEDSDNNGTVDRVTLTLTEAASTQTAVIGDFTYVAQDITDSVLASGTLSYPDTSTVRLVLGTAGDSGITSHTTAPTIAYTDGGATAIADAAGNQLATFGTTNLSDGAAPVITDFTYQDNDGDGKTDRVVATFSETVTAASVLRPNDLNLTNVGDFTSAAFGSDTTDAISGSVSTATLTLGTEASVVDTAEDSGNIAISSQNGFSLTDGTNTNTTLGAQTQASFTDGAAPLSTAYSYLDTDTDGQVDRFDVTFSENIAYDECDTADYTVGGADAGSIAVASCASSTTDLRLTVSNAPAEDTNLTLTLAYTAANGTANSLDDAAGNAVADISAQSLTDAAAPQLISQTYDDSDANGTVDRVTLTLSEAASTQTAVIGDFTYVAQDITGSALASGTLSYPTTSTIRLVLGTAGNSGITGHTTAPTIAYTDGGATAVADAAGNQLATFGTTNLTDGAAPVITDFTYQDNDGDGKIDRMVTTFSETVTAASVLRPNDLNLTNVGDFTSAAFGSDTTDAISGSVTTATLTLGTEASVVDTNEGSSNIAISSQNGFSLTDGNNTNTTLGAQTQASFTDGASPISTAYAYKDTNGDGQVNRVDVTFSENIAQDECEAGDYAFGGGDAGSIAVSSCATSTTDLQLTISDAPANDTNLTLTWAYDKEGTTDDSLDDAAGNAVADISAQSLTDAAAPIVTAQEYQDSDANGTVDRVVLTLSEAASTQTAVIGDFTYAAQDITGSALASGTLSYPTTSTVRLVLGTAGNSGITGHTTAPTIAYTDGGATAVADAAGNQLATFGATNLSDAATPVITDFTYQDNDGDGKIDRVVTTFSETVTAASVLRPNDLNLTNVGDFTSAAFGSDTTDAISGSVTTATLTLGTEASVVDTAEDSGNIAISSQNGFSLTDGTNTNTTLGAQTQASFTDGAAPISTAYAYKDLLGDGQIETVEVTFSENIAYDECEAGDYAFGGGDAGSIAVSGCATSGTALRYTISNAPASDTNLALTWAYDTDAGTSGSVDDAAGNAVADISAQSLTDAAAPMSTAYSYKDTDADGQVDRFDITFTENIGQDECEAGDFTIGGADAGTIAVASCATSTTDLQLTVSNATADDTNLTLTWAYDQSAGTADSLDDAAGNAVVDVSAQPISDGAAPQITDFTYQDNDGDGKIDQVVATFSETVTAASVLRPADLNLTNVGDFTSAAFGSDTTDAISGSVTTATLTLGTEASVVDTNEGSSNIAISSQNNFSLTDGNNTNNTLGAQTVASFTDGAAPVSTAYSYLDINGNGQVDRFDITFSENIAQDECEAGDFAVGGADAGSIAVASCATSTTDLRLTVSNAPASDTNLTLTWAYDKEGNVDDSLDDAAGNAVADISAQTLADAAAPVSIAYSYKDTNTDGQIDRFDITFTENIAYDECDAADYTVGGADAGSIAVSSCAASTTDLQLTVTGATADDTNLTLTLAYTAANGTADSLDDAAGNAVVDISAQSLDDDAAPFMTAAVTADNDSDGQIDRVVVTLSEDLDENSVAGADFTVGSFTVSSASETSAGVVTIVLTESGGADTDATPTVTIAGTITDAANDIDATSGTEASTDGAAPVSSTYAYKDTDADGTVDRVDVTFSENIAQDECEAGDYAFGGGDAGSIAVSSCTVSGDDLQLTISDATASDTNLTLTWAYDKEGTTDDSLDDAAGNAVADISAQTLDDAAAPLISAQQYEDSDNNGTVDRVTLTLTEAASTQTAVIGDFTYVAQDITGSALASGTLSYPTTSTVRLVLGTAGNSGITSHTTAPTIAYTDGGATAVADAAGNQLATFGTTNLTDGAAPVITDFTYQDNDGDGKIDRIVATFSETVTADSVLRAADLTLTNVGDFTSAAFGSNTTDLITGSVSSVTVTLGTEATVVDTNEGSSNIAISSQNNFSLTEGTNTNNTLGAQSQASFTDAAAPVSTAYAYKDTDSDGTVDRVDVTFSENIAQDECEAGDYAFAGGDAGTIAVSTCNAAGDDLQLTISNATASDTNLTLTWAYDASAGTASSLDDATGNAVADISAQTLTDAAAPVSTAYAYKDTDADGQVDRVDVTFTENIAYDECEAGDYAFAGDDAGTIAVSSCAVSGDDLRLTISNATADDTNLTLTWAYDKEGTTDDSLDDAAGNAVADISAQTLTDSAAPFMTAAVTADNDGNGQIDRVVVTLSEDLTEGTVAGADFTVGSFTVSSASETSAGVVTIVLTESGTADTDATPTVTLAGSIDDTGSNSATSGTEAPTDGAAPVSSAYSYKDTNSDGTVDRVDVTFSENIAQDECEAADYAFAGDDAGSIAVSSCAVSGDDLQLTISNATASDTSLTLTWAYDKEGDVDDSLDDAAGNAVADISAQTLVDAAAPVKVSQSYKDTDVDGVVDRVDITFTENIAYDECEAGDFTFAGDDAGSIAVASCAASTTDLQLTISDATADDTNLTLTLAYAAANGTASSLDDAAGNAVADITAASITDAAAPFMTAAATGDNDSDGQIDRVVVTLSEDLDESTVAGADFTVAGFVVSSASETSAGVVTIVLTESGSADTDATPTVTLAGSIDDTGSNSATSGTEAPTDGAAPVSSAYSYKDTDSDGTVDRVDVTFSENIAQDECEAGDYTFGGADAGTIAVSSCAVSGDDLRLTISNATANDTSLTLTWAYDKEGTTDDSLDDAAGNAVADISAQTVTDSAGPLITSTTPESGEDNYQRTEDIVINFTEAIDTSSFTVSFSPDPDGVSTSWSNSNATATIAHNIFQSTTNYTITVTAAPDTSANSFVGAISGVTHPILLTSAAAGGVKPPVVVYVPYVPVDNSDDDDETTGPDTDTDTETTDSTEEETETEETEETVTGTMDYELDQDSNKWNSDQTGYRPNTINEAPSPVTGEEEDVNEVWSGMFISSPSFSTVYYIDDNLLRRPFFNAQIFFTWASSWDVVIEVTDATLSTLIMGAPILPQPGVVLVKIQSLPQVYALEYNPSEPLKPILRWITDEETAIVLYGVNWADYVIDIDPTLFARFETSGEIIDEASDYSIDQDITRTRLELASY